MAGKKQQRKVASSKHGDKDNEKDNDCIYNDKDDDTWYHPETMSNIPEHSNNSTHKESCCVNFK